MHLHLDKEGQKYEESIKNKHLYHVEFTSLLNKQMLTKRVRNEYYEINCKVKFNTLKYVTYDAVQTKVRP